MNNKLPTIVDVWELQTRRIETMFLPKRSRVRPFASLNKYPYDLWTKRYQQCCVIHSQLLGQHILANQRLSAAQAMRATVNRKMKVIRLERMNYAQNPS